MRLLLPLLLFCSLPVAAQYAGGEGDGFTRILIVQQSLDGTPSGIRALYLGGDGDGFDRKTGVALLIGGGGMLPIYAGGDGDGFDRALGVAQILDGGMLPLYAGGDGDGFDRALAVAQILDGGMLPLYAGGDGDGFDRALAVAQILDGGMLPLYAGGDGDGFDQALAVAQLLDGGMLPLYAGGDGDGFDVSLLSATVLSGQTLAALFAGGDGDGFDTEIFAGVLPLPLTLIRFDAFPGEDFVLLRWQTEDEIDTDYFTIEKTRDGLAFVEVGRTEASGFSEPGERLDYELTDHRPYAGTSFYRLRTTDLDGAIHLSHLVEVNYSAETDWDFTVFPNPNTGRHFSVRPEGSPEGDLLVSVIDATGRLLLRETIPAGLATSHRLDLAQRLVPGSYLIRATDARGATKAKLLLVGGRP